MALQTPLYEEHVKLSGKIVEFAGYFLPVQFPPGIANEHRCVRQEAGLFDVSHMGELVLQGRDCYAFLDELLPRDFSKIGQALTDQRALYSVMCATDGTAVDDLLIYPLGEQDCLLVVNAANIETDYRHMDDQLLIWLSLHPGADVQLSNHSDQWAQLALQGPKSLRILKTLLQQNPQQPFFCADDYADFKQLKRYQFRVLHAGSLIVSRTGYTGEDGYEFYLPPQDAPQLWQLLIAAGAEPIGLGARDTLRLEAGMPLYGHELSRSITPREAGLDRFMALNKPQFVGKAALQNPPQRTLIGLISSGKAIPRADYPVLFKGQVVGHVTSGTFSPTLNQGLAMALVTREAADAYALDTDEWAIEVRGKPESFNRCSLPFVPHHEPLKEE